MKINGHNPLITGIMQQSIALSSNDYITNDIESMWSRCIRVWREAGRAQDYPHGMRRMSHTPSHATKLAREFAATFCTTPDYVVEQLNDEDPIIRLIAFDIIEMIAWEQSSGDNPLSPTLLAIDSPVPPTAMQEIKTDSCVRSFSGQTIGEFLPFLIEHG